MKIKKHEIFLLLLLIGATFLILGLIKEKNSLKKKYLLFKTISEKCEIDTSLYQLVYMSDDSCDYIVIKKRDSGFNLFGKNSISSSVKQRDKNFIQFAEEIDTLDAIKLIERYNDNNNSELENTSAINFEYDVITQYLVNAKIKNPKLAYMKIYFGQYDSTTSVGEERRNRNTVIVTVADGEKEYYLGNDEDKVINYGGLCPPPRTAAEMHDMGIFLLERAIKESDNPRLRLRAGIKKK